MVVNREDSVESVGSGTRQLMRWLQLRFDGRSTMYKVNSGRADTPAAVTLTYF